MTSREILKRLEKGIRNYLDKDGCMPVEGYSNQFYDGVIWAYARLTEIQPSDEERPKGEWGKWIIAEVQCPKCFEYFDTDCYSKEELKKCPNCGADMRKGGAE